MTGGDNRSAGAFERALQALRDLVLARLSEAMAPEDGAAPSAAMIAAAARFLKEHAPPSVSIETAGAPTPRSGGAPRPHFNSDLDPDPDDDPESVREDAALIARAPER